MRSGGAAEEFRQRRRQGVECLLACLTGGNAFRSGLSIAKRFKNNVIKPGRKVARQTSLKFRGQFRICLGVIGKHLVPGVFHRLTRRTRVHYGVNRLRHFKGTVLPAEFGLGGRNFFVTQGFTVGLCGTGAVRGPEADHGLGDNQRRTVFFSLGFGNRLIHGIDVVAVHRADHVPAVGFKALTGVVGEPPLHIAVNGNTVVVVNGDEFVKPPDTRQRTDFVADAFHHAAVTQKHIGAVVNHREPFTVKFRGKHFFRKRHTHGVGDTLSEGARRRFNARGHAHFGVARRFTSHLTEVFDVIHREVVTGEMQQRILQHRAVAVGKDETIAADPVWVGRVVTQMPRPKSYSDIGHTHGHAGVAAFGLLNSINGESTDGVGHHLRGDGIGHKGRIILENLRKLHPQQIPRARSLPLLSRKSQSARHLPIFGIVTKDGRAPASGQGLFTCGP